MLLKGTRETRCRPSRRGAWLRGHMVSSPEADCNLREMAPLPRNILHSLASPVRIPGAATERHNGLPRLVSQSYHASKARQGTCLHCRRSGYHEEWDGLSDNRHLNDLAEFIIVNVGDPVNDVKESGPPMHSWGVSVVIVL
jgi:hypothetical protein